MGRYPRVGGGRCKALRCRFVRGQVEAEQRRSGRHRPRRMAPVSGAVHCVPVAAAIDPTPCRILRQLESRCRQLVSDLTLPGSTASRRSTSSTIWPIDPAASACMRQSSEKEHMRRRPHSGGCGRRCAGSRAGMGFQHARVGISGGTRTECIALVLLGEGARAQRSRCLAPPRATFLARDPARADTACSGREFSRIRASLRPPKRTKSASVEDVPRPCALSLGTLNPLR